MRHHPRRSALEVLETRIAPAAFYVSGTSLEITNAAGIVQDGDSAAATDAGVDHAQLLHAGDRLYFNPDGVVGTHQTDRLWVTVSAGKALVFFKDFNSDQLFSFDELSGLAVGDGFSGSVSGDIHGSVATMLDRDGHFTPSQLQRASISRLTITGAIISDGLTVANLLAGRDLSNVTVLGQTYPGGESVDGIVATGTAALYSAWGFGTSGIFDDSAFETVPGTNGGDVTNAHFSGGIRGILTGDGIPSSGPAGRGGSMVNVSIGDAPGAFQIATGVGGDSEGGRGGAGGSITGFRIAFHSSAGAGLEVITGSGGSGFSGNGGAGGSILNSSFQSLDAATSFTLQTGEGGESFSHGNGGAGGRMVNTSILLFGDLASDDEEAGNLGISLGKGGDAHLFDYTDENGDPVILPSGHGGAGGSWTWIPTMKNAALLHAISAGSGSALVAQGLAHFHLEAGAGGVSDSSVGGAGGSIFGGRFNFRGALGDSGTGDFRVLGGAGGNGATGGGDAGHVQAASFSFTKAVFATTDFRVSGGAGGTLLGEVGGAAGGGDGGALRQLVFEFQETVAVDNEFSFRGGLGGEDQGALGDGGHGGPIQGLSILSRNGIVSSLIVSAGAGGPVGSEAALPLGAGGAGGGIGGLLIQTPFIDNLSLTTGDGGESTGLGRGGRGGDFSTGLGFVPHPLVDPVLSKRLHTRAGVYVSQSLGEFGLQLGTGGAGGNGNGEDDEDEFRSQGGSGGDGGSLHHSTFILPGSGSELLISGGGGGVAANHGTAGLSGGIDHVSFHVDGDVASVRIALDAGGNTDLDGSTGAGRSYSYLDLVITGTVAETVIIAAPAPGTGSILDPAPGGAGGAIDHLHLEIGDVMGSIYPPDGTPFDGTYGLQIIAGRGEDGRTAGAGGGITHSSITTGALSAGALLLAGDGGFSDEGAGALGGSISGNFLHFRGDLGGELAVEAGGGGLSLGDGTAGGRGGAVSATSIVLKGALSVKIYAGPAGFGDSPLGQSGGAIDRLTLENTGLVSKVVVFAGFGESHNTAQSGAGGAISRSTYSNLGGAGEVVFQGGFGGLNGDRTDGLPKVTTAGAGGAITDFTFNNAAALTTALFQGGDGGIIYDEVPESAGSGGAGGAVTGFVLHDSSGSGVIHVAGGPGGGGDGNTGRGGAGGAVVGTRLESLGAITVSGGAAGSVTFPGTSSIGGAGGTISSITGSVGRLSLVAGDGGLASQGGAGGSVLGVNLSAVTDFVRLIKAGNGGASEAAGGTGGVGGSISNVTVPGDIGDFHSAFGTGPSDMGGLVAGAGGYVGGDPQGKAGSVAHVTARRIAAIYTNVVTFGLGAVGSITAVQAEVIGAETNLAGDEDEPSLRGDGTFTYLDIDGEAGFSASLDQPVDGLVLVRQAGFSATSLSATPLYLVLTAD